MGNGNLGFFGGYPTGDSREALRKIDRLPKHSLLDNRLRVFNTKKNQWFEVQLCSEDGGDAIPRADASMAFRDGKCYVFGGITGNAYLASLEVFTLCECSPIFPSSDRLVDYVSDYCLFQ